MAGLGDGAGEREVGGVGTGGGEEAVRQKLVGSFPRPACLSTSYQPMMLQGSACSQGDKMML